MEVIAFIGTAGSGKSYRAQKVAHDIGADAIIDDGLLIHGSRILAGSSAKNEQNRIQAVKRAIFSDLEHLKKVKAALQKLKPKRILVLGTSEEMVNRIASKLDLPTPEKYIKIEEVSSKRDIAKARESRYREGKHIVPVPTVELKPHYSGYLIDPLRGFFNKHRPAHEHAAKSIIRPSFSMYGKMLIADSAIEDIVKLAALEVNGVKSAGNIKIKMLEDDRRSVFVNLETTLFYGTIIKETVHSIQTAVKHQVEWMTAMDVLAVNVSVRRLVVR